MKSLRIFMILSYPKPEKSAGWDAGGKGSFFHLAVKIGYGRK